MIQSLAKRKDLLILPTDKGKAAVIMDKDEYMEKIKVMLSDEKVYKKLKKDPAHGYTEKLVASSQAYNVRIRSLGASIQTYIPCPTRNPAIQLT